MKKTEIRILIGIVIAIAVAIFVMNNPFKEKKSGVQVAIRYQNTIVQTFDPQVDAVYHIKGSYGNLDVEVKDGKWRVTNEDCPNHICSSVGWVGVGESTPIVCMPNEVIIMEMNNEGQ